MNIEKTKKLFAKNLLELLGEKGKMIWQETEKEFLKLKKDLDFLKTSQNTMDKRLETAALFLALIKSLEKQGADFEEIRKICLELAAELVKPKNRLQVWAKIWIAKLVTTPFFQKLLAKKMQSVKNSPEGFVVELVKGDRENFDFGFDIKECGICKLYRKQQAEKYAKILCEVDYMTSEIAGLQLNRSMTIANGGEKCDFRFKKK